jgi:hypothetical protein
MLRLPIALTCAVLGIACAASRAPPPAHLDPSNPEAAEAPPHAAGAALSSGSEADGREGTTVYACPMHPEVTSERPGTCHKCGMALEPQQDSSSAAVTYACPMHPEVTSDRPGTCPKCGMALEPQPTHAPDAGSGNEGPPGHGGHEGHKGHEGHGG